MTEAKFGKDKVLMFRKLGDKKAAAKLALQIEHKWEYERSTDITKTKDGAVVSDGGLETKLTIEAIATKDELNTLLKNSVIEGFKLEVWEVDLAGEKQGGKFAALYAIGRLATWEVPANVEDLEQVSTEMTIEGVPQAGFATLSAQQQEEIMYAFKDTVAYQ
ncbi:phage major tail protein, TP901-1 family [Gemella sp. GH3]|uniref:phage major tail protein, TP901-1 family n=1 Tax=unclassified Gemella TaxID=2624949 RepID=UPI0015CFBECB|nr:MULTISPECIES: phage major tail protein, TP901-1 family [unclassified Gemella]MBF0714493.1 phage major tail protein, TP901-1 family [Gemella sp. GH3.1]NYS51445.1 phage major tail protein, TP901-1 family [Gemella sp. GH3]